MFKIHAEEIEFNLNRYFAGKEGDLFTGRHFETFAAMGDTDRFEATDVLAVEALSVEVPPEAAVILIDTTMAEPLNDELRQIPSDRDLWEVRRSLVEDGGPAAKLHAKLQGLPGIGWVTAGKLMAAKRPRLIPVFDNLVRGLLRPPKNGFWVSMYDQLTDEVRRTEISKVVSAAPENVSLLRRIDVALWMHEWVPLQNAKVSSAIARRAVANYLDMLPEEFRVAKAPAGSAHDGLWYVWELDAEKGPIDDCCWIVLPDHSVTRGVPVGNPIHLPTPREELLPDFR